MTTDRNSPAPQHWYGAETERARAIEVLEHIRGYAAADTAMQRRSEKAMGLNENDISALRYLLRADERGTTVGPRELAEYLGIQSSSITVLLDRLEKAGHIRRVPSPFDRRALIIVPTPPTDQVQRAISARRTPRPSSRSSAGCGTRSTGSAHLSRTASKRPRRPADRRPD
jgi:DNA-binding MarR family transcriptional regulator